MQRVLIIRSNPVAPDPRVEKIAHALGHANYAITVLGWDPTCQHPPREEKECYSMIRIPLRASFGRGLANLGHEARWQIVLLGWLFRHHQEFDIIHACDFDTVIPALLCRFLWRKKVVYDIFDFYADMLRRTPGPLVRLLRKAELWAIGIADAVIIVDDARRAQITGSHPRRLGVIYNSPEPLTWDPGNLPASPPNCLKIAYVGNLQQERSLDLMLETVSRHPNWQLDLAGFGPDVDRAKAIAGLYPNIHWHGQIPYQEALRLNANADILVAMYDPRVAINRFASPNKVFEAMLLGKPIIVARGTNADLLVEKAGCGIALSFGDAAAFEAACEQFAANPVLRAELGANAANAYQQTYHWDHMRQRLIDLYASLDTRPQ